MAQYVIQVKNLNKSYAKLKAVDNFSFSVPASSCYGFLGPNGAGKTTTMKMIYGKTIRDKNINTDVSILGFDPLTEELNIKYLSGVVPQENNLDDALNVLENLKVYSRFYSLTGKKALKRIDELLKFMELSDKKKAGIRELSGGMKRRLVIARALINKPRLLILDEPTTGLDPQVRHLIWNKLRQLKKAKTTILLTTHYMEEAFQICDHILIMDRGKKIIEGKPGELVKNNIEKWVLEIQNKQILSRIKKTTIKSKIRKDASHDIILLYSDKIDDLKKLISGLKPGEYYLRQSNLEDVFLKTTGRELNDAQ